ncbi:MAG TPA: hypothetical protein PLL10_06070, partial [Elusimicrobiales bacterium]|nr:hypothetical protein [Elusimicrobiales bacterium]
VTFFSFALILLFLLNCCAPQPHNQREKWLFPLVAIALYSAGYIPIVVRARYLYFCYLLLYVMGAAALSQLFKSDFFTPARRNITLAAFVLSMLVSPLTNLIDNFSQGREIVPISARLSKLPGLKGEKIASNALWMEMLYISYYTGARYYGEARKGITAGELAGELDKFGVRYFLVWNDSLLALPGWRELPGNGIVNLRILEREARGKIH